MFQKSCSTLRTHFPVFQLPLPAAPIFRRKRRQSSLQVPLLPPCQPAKIIWTRTGQLNKRTARRQLITFCQQGCPDRTHVKGDLSPYWHVRGDLTLYDNLLQYGSGIIVPRSLQAATLQKIHNGHQDIQSCRQRSTLSVWWPGVSKHFEHLLKSCPICAKTSILHKEPLMCSHLPNHP